MNNFSLMNMMFYMMMMSIMTMMLSLNLHPTRQIMMLIGFSSTASLGLSSSMKNPLYSIMLFMIMISGVLMIFLYFSSLISNEQSKFSKSTYLVPIVACLALALPYGASQIKMNEETEPMLSTNESMFSNIKMIYEYPLTNMTTSSMIYLMVSMLAIIKICSLKNMTLRKIT